jgi:acetylornithine deacetylase/succinyl-diaminopimelate desuccinylase-like protein
MTSSIDPVELARALIACPSITPARGEVFDVLDAALRANGFEVHRWVMGEAPDGPTENMVAMRGSGAPHFGFAGHLDVVPPGDGWDSDPFDPVVVDGVLTGRGANDMKSAIAAFTAAAATFPQGKGTLSFLITGDEEGYATYGTPRIIAALDELTLDEGAEPFPRSNLEFTGISTPTHASNVIPGTATAQLNIRFNNLHKGADLVRMVEEIAEHEAPGSAVRARISGEAFLTPPGPLYDVVVEAIREETGEEPELSTSGGTSDGRFLIALCPVVDFGLPNATMHKVGESAALEDIHALSRIYERVVRKVLG